MDIFFEKGQDRNNCAQIVRQKFVRRRAVGYFIPGCIDAGRMQYG